jgi:hypothetical protein
VSYKCIIWDVIGDRRGACAFQMTAKVIVQALRKGNTCNGNVCKSKESKEIHVTAMHVMVRRVRIMHVRVMHGMV